MKLSPCECGQTGRHACHVHGTVMVVWRRRHAPLLKVMTAGLEPIDEGRIGYASASSPTGIVAREIERDEWGIARSWRWVPA